VFTGEDGKPIDPNYVSRAFRNAVAAAGLRHIPLHGLRHSHASLLIDAGVPISVVSERLGHANPNVTLGVYTHQLRDSQAKAACTAADLVRKVAD
jgi:integrase